MSFAKPTRFLLFLFSSFILTVFSNAQVKLFPQPEMGAFAGQAENSANSKELGLLFNLSEEKQFAADFAAGGQINPNFLEGVKTIPTGAFGKGFEADDDQVMSYWAPGNIFAQRGTLSFFWRSRYPVGPTPFPIFRVAYADHTSWDMAWLRIDYNGAGFDAFVTDIGLSRTRVSYFIDKFPKPDEWTHLVLSWDETEGIRFYINGKLVEKKSLVGTVFDAGLDQFGPHSRIISPYQVQSAFSFMRGGDIDEIRIYDRMLSDENIKDLHLGKIPKSIPSLHRNLDDRIWRENWWKRHGWNLPNPAPALLPDKFTSIKKVEIHEVYDVKRWFWKANDGIRETTWPGVYNMSRLPGRYDYFVLPDWDCYSTSGQSVKFQIPDENWNHLEIFGTAWGQITLEKPHEYDNTFAVRSKNQVKSFHQLEKTETGGTLRFDNALIEEPIGELGIYNIQKGSAPQGDFSEKFYLLPFQQKNQESSLAEITAFIDGRFPEDERTKMWGSLAPTSSTNNSENTQKLPFIHVIIPYKNNAEFGLNGIEIEIPALEITTTHGNRYPVNLRIKDPLWPLRDLADISFSLQAKKPQTIWIDTRDRLLPEGKALYFSIAGAGYGLNSETLTNAKVRLVYKSKEAAIAEHELDRFTQVRDVYSHLIEERPNNSRLNLFNRFEADRNDLLKANPNNQMAKAYQFAYFRNKKYRPDYQISECPEGIPEWAFLQSEYMKLLANIANYYIDKRQISNGEFGGGLSDDDDFTNILAGIGLLGIETEKINKSLQLFLEAFYDNERDVYNSPLRHPSLPMFTNGLATITTDLLHAYEEGMEAVGQLMLVDYGNPVYFNRGLETAKKVLDELSGKATNGHRYFKSRFFGGTSLSEDEPYNWSGAYSYNLLHSSYLISRYNGNPTIQKLIVELADGLLAIQEKHGDFYTDIQFNTLNVRGRTGLQGTWQVFYAAYEITGNEKYKKPIPERFQISWNFDEIEICNRYQENIKDLGAQEFINTEGSIWIDRVAANFNDLQTDRLGGVAIARIHNIYPQNYLSWEMEKPGAFKNLATFVLEANSTKLNVLAFNLTHKPVDAKMKVWRIIPGKWKITEGIDRNNDNKIDSIIQEQVLELEKGSEINVQFSPLKNTIINLVLEEPNKTPYWKLPDLAIHSKYMLQSENEIKVRVYNQGAIKSPSTTIEIRDLSGKTIAKSVVPEIEAPLDLVPKYMEIQLKIPKDFQLTGCKIIVDPDEKIKQITRSNDMFEG